MVVSIQKAEENPLSRGSEIVIYLTLGICIGFIIVFSIISIFYATLALLGFIIIFVGGIVALITILRMSDEESKRLDILLALSLIMVISGASLFKLIFFIVAPLSVLSMALVFYGKHYREREPANMFMIAGVCVCVIISIVFLINFYSTWMI